MIFVANVAFELLGIRIRVSVCSVCAFHFISLFFLFDDARDTKFTLQIYFICLFSALYIACMTFMSPPSVELIACMDCTIVNACTPETFHLNDVINSVHISFIFELLLQLSAFFHLVSLFVWCFF